MQGIILFYYYGKILVLSDVFWDLWMGPLFFLDKI